MKLSVYAVVFLSLLSSAGAQISPGTITTGGAVSFSNQSQDNSEASGATAEISTTNFTFQPQVGYVIVENLTIGLSPFISTSKDESYYASPVVVESPTKFLFNYNSSVTKSTGYGVGVFASYHYFVDPGIAFIVQTGASIGMHKGKTDQYMSDVLLSTYDTEYTTIGATASVGCAFFVTNTIELAAMFDIVRFTSQSSITDSQISATSRHSESTVSNITASLNPTTLQLSARYLFR